MSEILNRVTGWLTAEFETAMVWIGFASLVLALLALLCLLAEARMQELRQLRLQRAVSRLGAGGPGAAPLSPRHSLAAAGTRATARILARIGDRIDVLLGGEGAATARDLEAAGFHGRDALVVYAILKTVLPVSIVAAGAILATGSERGWAGLAIPAATVLALALAVSKGLDIALDVLRKRRLDQLRRGLPDLLELLVITSEAGLGPQPALHRVARELAPAHPDLSREILKMVSETRLTNDRQSAYAHLCDRVPLPEIATFTQALHQSDTYGTPFSRAMRTLTAELRGDRLHRIEEQASRLPVLMTVPLIFCIMPSVFIVLVGPAVLRILDNILTGA
ncbi:type II secretion system F family protein [Roseicyclus persicicus]|uniref:Type II secretion system F family protein n=1 Tax=Roseicyclus persicicus TaxID=2650661 RepID=A0A7X6H368_9RHOB|nr:type II secretion system F family protein [Roseibacterium persicicum]NKX45937.1 type II secretion system F family protein [Roseibacterium persicicum]